MTSAADSAVGSSADRAGSEPRSVSQPPPGLGRRGQANLPALAVALVVLTSVTALALGFADGAMADADRDALERRAAVSLSDRLVAADSPVTDGPNVLRRNALANLSGRTLETRFPVVEGRSVRIEVGDEVVAETGAVHGGTTIRRVVLVATRDERTLEPDFAAGHAVTLPRRTDRVVLHLQPDGGRSIRTVRADDRVLLHDPDGLSGRYVIEPSRLETTTLRFAATGRLRQGAVRVRTEPLVTTKAFLEVTVDG